LSFSGELLLYRHGRTLVEDVTATATGLDSLFKERLGTLGQEEDTGKKAQVVHDRVATDKNNSARRALIVATERVK
jgi:hypothetical protein